MELPSIVDVSDSETDDGEVELFMPSQANKAAYGVGLDQLFGAEHLNDSLSSPSLQGPGKLYSSSALGQLPGLHAADKQATYQAPSTTFELIRAAAEPLTAGSTRSAAAASSTPEHAAVGPAAASVAPAPAAASKAAPPAPQAAATAAEAALLNELVSVAAAAVPEAPTVPEAHVLTAPSILDDLDLDALLNRLSTTAAAVTGTTISAHALPVSMVADSRFTSSPAKASSGDPSPAADAAAVDTDQLTSPVYQPRWAKEAQGYTAAAAAALDWPLGHRAALRSQAGRLVNQYAGPGSSSNSSKSSKSSSTSNSPNQARLWVEPRPVVRVDLRPDTRGKNPGAGAAATSMQMPPRFAFGRAGRSSGAPAAGGVAPGVTTSVEAVPTPAKTADPAAPSEADISDWWEGGGGGKQQQSESSDSEDEWLEFRQQHRKHRLSQQQ